MYKVDELNAEIAVSKGEALWQRVKREAEGLIAQSEENLVIQREMLKLANAKIKEEISKCTFHISPTGRGRK